jgi:hypothetical protein
MTESSKLKAQRLMLEHLRCLPERVKYESDLSGDF